ncbi:cytochrome c family protein [Roseibium porphyridii]|uniref:Cytochrome c family protein n=1 Tax=Roseibium porphyridii TaxID=2866279 RepID=A0ABY8FAS5_9HYPH|nr:MULTISPECIES: cytochrome c family protein [Stappiaceae]QFT34771.1 Cytochrome c-552 [Labrenzia sp. THAF82]WFE89733.1 cytochrome c family protein [Roseibium sp. KMA01]
MDSFTLNKIAGAILMVLILTMGVGIVSDIIFHPTIPGKPGYEIVVASAEDSTSEVQPEPDVVPISELLLAASASEGEKVAKKCAACHTFDDGGANKVGPALWDVVGRKPGGVDGFGYSAAMNEYGAANAEWTYEGLESFLASPKKYIPGTSMGFAGLRKPEERANMIAYMRELSASPKPLPTE